MLLNRQTLSAIQKTGRVEIGPLDLFPEKVIQFGSGNFLRGFADWMINELNKRGLFNGRVIIVKMLPSASRGAINRQDGLYTLLTRGMVEGTVLEKAEIITAVSRELNPYSEWTQFLECAELPELRYVVSNSTEAGIEYVKTEKPLEECPASFPAKLAAFLFHRYRCFNGGTDKGMVVLPCELIERNGAVLKELIHRHASDWKLDRGFAVWLDTSCIFLNTLVDRIVPGFPADEAASLARSLGYEDDLMVAVEPFHQWVLEGGASVAGELPFADAGLNVHWTDTLVPYRTRKVRILNGAHTMCALAAYQAGEETVLDMVKNESVGKLMRLGLFSEIIPTLGLPEATTSDFAAQVMERFQNPFIKHQLLGISLNSVSKFKVRVLPSLLKYIELKDRIPSALVFSLAALMTFYRVRPDGSGHYIGERAGKPYEAKDNPEYLNFFHRQWMASGRDYSALSKSILSNESLWERDLSTLAGLVDSTAAHIKLIVEEGMPAALRKVSLH
jgi:tagaturonate reductase